MYSLTFIVISWPSSLYETNHGKLHGCKLDKEFNSEVYTAADQVWEKD